MRGTRASCCAHTVAFVRDDNGPSRRVFSKVGFERVADEDRDSIEGRAVDLEVFRVDPLLRQLVANLQPGRTIAVDHHRQHAAVNVLRTGDLWGVGRQVSVALQPRCCHRGARRQLCDSVGGTKRKASQVVELSTQLLQFIWHAFACEVGVLLDS